MRYSEACDFYHDFPNGLLLTRKILTQAFLGFKLKSSLNSIKTSFFDNVTPPPTVDWCFSVPWMGLFRAQNLSRYLVLIVNNVQRPHVFCYFREDTTGKIVGGVLGTLFLLAVAIAVTVYEVKKENKTTVRVFTI